ncbi:MAG TPA: cytochrome P460 family protein [Cellvibrio sp.]|nr:cytochrome P460 family protein [Cellvibrio sp.]
MHRKIIIILTGSFLLLSAAFSGAAATNKAAATFGPDNTLLRPANYREWIYIGTALTPHDLNGGKADFPEFHNVYMDQVGWKAWKKRGEFADRTVIAKELLSVGAHQAISGKGYFQGDFALLAVAVKDKRRFAAEPGNWGYYLFEPAATTSAQPMRSADCAACHQAHAATDLVFSQYYPLLRAAKPSQQQRLHL